MRRIIVLVVAAALVLAPVTVPARWIVPLGLFALIGTAVGIIFSVVYRCVDGMRTDALIEADVTLRTSDLRHGS